MQEGQLWLCTPKIRKCPGNPKPVRHNFGEVTDKPLTNQGHVVHHATMKYLLLTILLSTTITLISCQTDALNDIVTSYETQSNTTEAPTQEPVIVSDPSGKLFLEHGELLDIKLKYNGSAPFFYCYTFCTDQDWLPCVCLTLTETSGNEIAITRYLHQLGNYYLLFKIRNSVNEVEKRYTIKITGTVRESTLPFVPIVSSVLAVIILITGVALHIHLRKTVNTETADFDFMGQEEEWDEEQSLIQRVKYFMCHSDNMDDYRDERRPLNPGRQNGLPYSTHQARV